MAERFLSRDEILGAPETETEVVEVPEWSGAVLVKALSGAERDRYEVSLTRMKGNRTTFNLVNARARLVALAVVDETGKHVFLPGDVEALGKKSAVALNRVFEVARRLAGMSPADIAELTENFTDGPSDASISG